MAPTNTVFGARGDPSWRNARFPIVGREMRFGIQLARYPVLYRTELTDAMLVSARVFTYNIPATDSLTIKAYPKWFSNSFPGFYQSFHGDTTPGTLADPVYGAFQALPLEWDEQLTQEDLNGVRLRVSFVEWINPVSSENEPPGALVDRAVAAAKALDDALTKVPNTVLSQKSHYPPYKSFSESIAQIKGVGDRLLRLGKKATATLHDVAGQCEALVATFDKCKNPGEAIGARSSAQRLHRVAVELARRISDPTRLVREITTNTNQTVTSLAADAGMAVSEVLTLNPALVTVNKIPPGTKVRIYRATASAVKSPSI